MQVVCSDRCSEMCSDMCSDMCVDMCLAWWCSELFWSQDSDNAAAKNSNECAICGAVGTHECDPWGTHRRVGQQKRERLMLHNAQQAPPMQSGGTHQLHDTRCFLHDSYGCDHESRQGIPIRVVTTEEQFLRGWPVSSELEANSKLRLWVESPKFIDLQGEYVRDPMQEMNGMPVWLRVGGGGMLFGGERWNLTADLNHPPTLPGRVQSALHAGRSPDQTAWMGDAFQLKNGLIRVVEFTRKRNAA